MLSCQNLFSIIGMVLDSCTEDGLDRVKQDEPVTIVNELIDMGAKHLRGELKEEYGSPVGARKLIFERGHQNLIDNRQEAEELIRRTLEEKEQIERDILAEN